MFGGIGGALKSLSGKAEEMIEKTKTSVGEMAAEKKAAAAAMLEGQAKKTGDLLWQTKTNAETGVSEIVTEGKAAAIDGFDKEVASAEKLVEEGLNEVSTTVDAKLKETDQFIDEKREQVVTSVQEETQKSTAAASEGFSSVLGKAKGLLNF